MERPYKLDVVLGLEDLIRSRRDETDVARGRAQVDAIRGTPGIREMAGRDGAAAGTGVHPAESTGRPLGVRDDYLMTGCAVPRAPGPSALLPAVQLRPGRRERREDC